MTPGEQSTSRRAYWVTVCDACRTASCWHGEFMCQASGGAGTTEVLASVLDAEDREHRDNYSEAELQRVCGSVRYADAERGRS